MRSRKTILLCVCAGCYVYVLQVASAVKALSSEQLVKFQEDGEIIVEGHTLTTEDIKVTSPWQHITMVTSSPAL